MYTDKKYKITFKSFNQNTTISNKKRTTIYNFGYLFENISFKKI